MRVEAKERQVRKPSDSVPETFPEQSGQSRDKAGAACGCRNFCQGTPPALSFPYGQRSPGPVKESSSVRHVEGSGVGTRGGAHRCAICAFVGLRSASHSSRVRAECNYADFRPRVIQHFCTASDVVKQRSTSSLIVSPESIANSRKLCTRSLGILNCTGVQLPVNSCEGPLFLRRRDGVVGDSSVAASSDSPIGESATGCTGLSSRAAARTATARRNSGVPNAIEVSSMSPPPCRLP